MAIRLIIFLLLVVSVNAWPGNGSSGVGTASILDGFTIKNMEDKLIKLEDKIIDKESSEEILKVITLSKEGLNLKDLPKAKLGAVQGYEYMPADDKKDNFWVICKTNAESCLKLVPLSKKNKKIPSILGSLTENID